MGCLDIRQDPLYIELSQSPNIACRVKATGDLMWVGARGVWPLESEVRRRKAGIDERTWDRMREPETLVGRAQRGDEAAVKILKDRVVG